MTFGFCLMLPGTGPQSSYASNHDYLPTNWSIELYSGPTFGHFSDKSKITPHGGIQIRYSFTPLVSGYARAGGGVFQSADNLFGGIDYKNSYLTYGIGIRANLLRMITGPESDLRNLGVFIASDVNIIRNDVTASSDDPDLFPVHSFSGSALTAGLGAGITFRVSDRVDLFTQFKTYFSGSDLLDGMETPSYRESVFIGGDAFMNTSAGITIKLGSSEIGHTDWYHRDHRLDPLAATLRESIQILEADIDQQNNTLASMHQRTEYLLHALQDLEYVIHSSGLTSVEDLEIRIEELRELLESGPALLREDEAILTTPDAFPDLEFDEEMEALPVDDADPENYFIVAGVYGSIENAELYLNDLLEQGYSNAGLIRDVNRNLYMVIYGGHATFQEAMQELDYIHREVNPEAWIYQF
ncbi:SPOR domain-containing protein [Balneolaceae bacterium ANBcel3]|nr:SPOR domain-containing protein [Balneolaceae bacterium ANBcel3]